MLALKILFYNSSLLGVALSTYAVYFSSKTLDSWSVTGFRLCKNLFSFIAAGVLMHVL